MGEESQPSQPTPPEGFSIIEEISPGVGKQKLVFKATWQPMQREVVIKFFTDPNTRAQRTAKELFAHPLFSSHPNIVETHVFSNKDGTPWLVEKLVQPLNNRWQVKGADMAATLLRDIASALSFLKVKGYIHGDIKPDNLGLDGSRFILMDFGVCRKEHEFPVGDATGTLRTRAPEVLDGSQKRSYASDLWALGATLLRVCTKRFPLVLPDEEALLDDPTQRGEIERRVIERAKTSSGDEMFWKNRALWEQVPRPLKELMRRILSRSPEARPSAEEVVRVCEEELSAYIYEESSERPMPTIEEVRSLARLSVQIGAKLETVLDSLPFFASQQYRQRLEELGKIINLPSSDAELIARLTKALRK